MSGYTHCACRDCFEVTVSDNVERPELCGLCEEAGCDRTGHDRCHVDDTDAHFDVDY
jgi:hypothetical protein